MYNFDNNQPSWPCILKKSMTKHNKTYKAKAIKMVLIIRNMFDCIYQQTKADKYSQVLAKNMDGSCVKWFVWIVHDYLGHLHSLQFITKGSFFQKESNGSKIIVSLTKRKQTYGI